MFSLYVCSLFCKLLFRSPSLIVQRKSVSQYTVRLVAVASLRPNVHNELKNEENMGKMHAFTVPIYEVSSVYGTQVYVFFRKAAIFNGKPNF